MLFKRDNISIASTWEVHWRAGRLQQAGWGVCNVRWHVRHTEVCSLTFLYFHNIYGVEGYQSGIRRNVELSLWPTLSVNCVCMRSVLKRLCGYIFKYTA